MDITISAFLSAALLLIGGVIVIAWKSDEYEQRRVTRFHEDLVHAILSGQPTWNQVVEMAETENVPLGKVYNFCRVCLKDILTGSDPNKLKEHRALIESYIREHRRTEPFEGLPNEIRIHLERLSDSLQGNHAQLEPLTQKIRELVAVHSAESKKQRRYTAGGFFLGILGFAFAGYAYFFPYSPSPTNLLPSTHLPSPSK